MSTSRRIVDLYIVGNQETDDTGRPKAQATRLLRCESVLLRVHLLNADGTPYADLPTSLAFQYGLDNSYAAGNADPVASNNAKFIPADWPGADGWNLALGRFCVRVSLKSSALGTALGTKPELLAKHAVWATPAGDDAFPIFSVPVYVDNVTVEPGNIVEPDEPDSYVTVDALAALLGSTQDAGNVSGVLTPDAALYKLVNGTMTGDVTLHAPSNPVEGRKLELRLLASGADRQLALNAGDFALPASSSLTWPVTVASGTESVLLLDYRARDSKWLVVAYVPGY